MGFYSVKKGGYVAAPCTTNPNLKPMLHTYYALSCVIHYYAVEIEIPW